MWFYLACGGVLGVFATLWAQLAIDELRAWRFRRVRPRGGRQ